MVSEFQFIFATYFYREEFTELGFRHYADTVDKEELLVAREDKTGRSDSERVTMRIPLTAVDECIA